MCSNRCMCNNNNSYDNDNNFSSVRSNTYNSYSNMMGSGYSSSNYNAMNNNFGSAFVPVQPFTTVFSPAQGLANGTMFPELVSSYCPNQSLEIMNYLRYNSNGGGCCRNGM